MMVSNCFLVEIESTTILTLMGTGSINGRFT